jgi:hypothetical protein
MSTATGIRPARKSLVAISSLFGISRDEEGCLLPATNPSPSAQVASEYSFAGLNNNDNIGVYET